MMDNQANGLAELLGIEVENKVAIRLTLEEIAYLLECIRLSPDTITCSDELLGKMLAAYKELNK